MNEGDRKTESIEGETEREETDREILLCGSDQWRRPVQKQIIFGATHTHRERERENNGKHTAAKTQFPSEMELSQRSRAGDLALTAAERRRNGAILAER